MDTTFTGYDSVHTLINKPSPMAFSRPPSSPAMLACAAAIAVVALIRFRRVRQQQKRIAFLNTEDAPKWVDQLEIFARALELPVSRFEKFDCFRGQYPSADALRHGVYVGVLITGSHFSCIDPALPWLLGLFECIRTCEELPHVNVLGCCFGCQAAAVALGGTVGNNPDGSFAFGVESVDLTLSELRVATLTLLESHGEQVLTLPRGATLVGTSASAPHELFVAGRHNNILCCQSHPEFDRHLLQARIEPALIAKGRLSAAQLRAMSEAPAHFYECCTAWESGPGGLCGGSLVGRRLYRDVLLEGITVALANLAETARAARE